MARISSVPCMAVHCCRRIMFASVHSESRASRILECHADTFLFSGNGSRSSHHLRVALPLETRFLAGVLGGSARPAPERLLPVVRAASISRSSSSSRSLRMSGLVSLSTTCSVLFSRRSSWKRLFMGVHSSPPPPPAHQHRTEGRFSTPM